MISLELKGPADLGDGLRVEPLDWDSAHFGFRCGRLCGLGPAIGGDSVKTVPDAVQQARELGYRHLTASIPSQQVEVVQTLEGCCFRFAEALLEFEYSEPGPPSLSPEYRKRFGTPQDVDALASMADGALLARRFHNDPTFTRDLADGVFREWTRDCLMGTAADAVLITEDSAGPLGFAAMQSSGESGEIPLVLTARRAQGTGVGGATLAAAMHWFFARDVRRVRIVTQLQNTASARLYLAIGFKLTGSSITLSISLP